LLLTTRLRFIDHSSGFGVLEQLKLGRNPNSEERGTKKSNG
ncbi:unnamed protein product, partial [Allacma fusca]